MDISPCGNSAGQAHTVFIAVFISRQHIQLVGVCLAPGSTDPEPVLHKRGTAERRRSLVVVPGEHRPVARDLARQSYRRYPALADIVAAPFNPLGTLEERAPGVFEPERCR